MDNGRWPTGSSSKSSTIVEDFTSKAAGDKVSRGFADPGKLGLPSLSMRGCDTELCLR